MNTVTNTGRAARVINAKIGETSQNGKAVPVTQLVHLAPGESADVEVLNADDPVFKGMVDRGDLFVGAKGELPPTPEAKAARDKAAHEAAVEAARKEGFDAGYAKALDDAKKKN